jgi:Protein of unknown function (DUF2795)
MEMSDVGHQTERRRCDEMLHGSDLPASKEDLITYVHRVRNRAQAALEILDQLPGRQYNSMADVEQPVGEII